MIRFIYWLLALIEVILVLAVLLLFIITDSRTIKYIAETSLDSSGLSYESVEGNLFDGLEVKKLSYEHKPLFSSALIHWNPLTLFYDKITITKFEAEGIELKNIIDMLNEMKSENLDEATILDYDLSLNSTHFDINPYIYEGVKFSSFVLETGKIEIDKDLTVNTDVLDLKFDSDIVNVSMNAKIEDNQLLVDNLDLKNISAKDIRKLTRRLKSNKKDKKLVFFKNIKIKHLLGTMKPVRYDDLKIEAATLHIYDGVVEVTNNFRYQVKKVNFTAKTNFGKLQYKGYVKDSNTYGKGHIFLDKNLFKKYNLPLNFKGLKKLSSSLRLNHHAIWIDIDHDVKKLLKIKNDFNIDVFKAKHKLHYDYTDGIFSIDSELDGQMTYANIFELKNKIFISDKGFSYKGEVLAKQLHDLPSVVTDYLLTNVAGKFKGNAEVFEIDLSSKFFNGLFNMKAYKSATLEFKSKTNNIELRKIIPNSPKVLQNELLRLEGKADFDFKNFDKSKINLNILSKTIDIDANMKLLKPYNIEFQTELKDEKVFKKFNNKINFSEIKKLNGSLELISNRYLFKAWNKELKFFLDYDHSKDLINMGSIQIDNQLFTFQKNYKNELSLNSRILNIQKFLKKIKRYYVLDIPNIEGSVDLLIKQHANEKFSVILKSPHLKYIFEKKVTNLYNLKTEFVFDNIMNIIIKNYKFRIDNNGYMNVFYSNNDSYLSYKSKELKIEKLWLNDKALIKGKYNLENERGILKVNAKKYSFNNKDFNLLFNLDLLININSNKVDISGDINILGGTISYELVGADIVEDSDIIITEELKKAKELPFKNLKLYVKIKSKKALNYVAEDINVKFFNELSIVKNFNQNMLVTGTSSISDGYYQLEDKRFVLDKSHLYFAGDIKKPLLDIKANYEKEQYNIHVFISGTTDAPIVNFNSDPYLTQQEILSLILFDGTGSSSGKGAEAYTLLGGSFAKGLIKSLGIDVDHLLLGKDREEQLSLEVGRKISKDISVLYLHRDGLDGVKVRIEHSKSFETDIIIQPPNTSSIEFLYKQDR